MGCSVIVVSICPYSCALCRIWMLYADCGLFGDVTDVFSECKLADIHIVTSMAFQFVFAIY